MLQRAECCYIVTMMHLTLLRVWALVLVAHLCSDVHLCLCTVFASCGESICTALHCCVICGDTGELSLPPQLNVCFSSLEFQWPTVQYDTAVCLRQNYLLAN
jgi:hypothetical protein